MKKIFRNLMAIAIAGMTFTACEDVPAPYDVFDEGTVIEAAGSGTVADPFNVKAAIAKCKEIGTTESTEKYYIKGIAATMATADGTYGNATFDIVDVEGGDAFKCYQVAGANGQKLPAGFTINKGDEVVIYGPIYNYNGKTPETVGKGAAYIVSVNGKSTDESSETPSEVNAKSVTIAEFNAAAESNDVWYQLTGTVKNLKEGDQYGNFDLEDETGSVYVYGLLSEKGGAKKLFQELVAAKGIKEGSKITIIGNRGSYNGKIEVMNAYFVSIEGEGTPAPEGVQTISVADFNAAAESTDVWYQLTGTVKNLKDGDQYGNFDLEDETGTVYVYGLLSEKGGAKKLFQELVAAKGIKEGSKITIIGNRGSYNGKIEVMNAYFVSIEGEDTPAPEGVQTISVADFNAAAESTDVWYQLTGTISNLKDGDQYGNFDLTDATGSVYVYGVLSEKGGAKKLFQELVSAHGIQNGTTITIIGNRGSYNGKIEVVNAYFVSASN